MTSANRYSKLGVLSVSNRAAGTGASNRSSSLDPDEEKPIEQSTTSQNDVSASRDAEISRLRREGALALGLDGIRSQLAHDLREPMQAISLHLALLRRAVRGELATMEGLQQKQEEWLGEVENGLEQLKARAERWTRLQGTADDEPRRFDLRVCLERIEEGMEAVARRHEVDLELHLPDGELPIRGVERALERLLMALIGLSLQRLEAGGRLRIDTVVEASRVELQSKPTGEKEAEPDEESAALLSLGEELATLGAELEVRDAGWRVIWTLAEPDGEGDGR